MNESRQATSVRVHDLRHSAEDPVNECNGIFRQSRQSLCGAIR
jgi:hypothetical protein